MSFIRRPKQHRHELANAQRNKCPLCGKGLGPLKELGRPRINFDHVWPRKYRYQHRGNLLVAHVSCNFYKGDRDPTGCELIWLAAVNARLGLELAPIEGLPNPATSD